MLYTDNQAKFVAVLNSKIEVPRLLNALGHITTGLVAKTSNTDSFDILSYPFHNAELSPAHLSRYPFIILKAKNGNQLKTLHHALHSTQIAHNVFADSMLGSSATEQIQQTQMTPIEELTYFCIVMFGEAKVIDPLTKKFSLYR